MRFRFTDLRLANIEQPGYHWDASLPGFGIAVGKRARTFVTVSQGERTKLGRYPALKLADARKRAALVLNNADVASATSVAEVLSFYLSSIKVRMRTASEYRRLLHTHMLPLVGGRAVSSLTAKDILRITDPLHSTPTECRHAHVAMQTFFNWCVPRHIAVSPMAGLKTPTKPNRRDRVLTYTELAAIWRVAAELGPYGHVVRLCVLTGQRRGEVAQIAPAWLTDATLTIPAEIAKNGRKHTIPLTANALVLAQKVPFRIHNWSRFKTRLDKLSGVQGWVLHDLRRTFATNLAELQVAPHVIERILNHSSGTISQLAATYNRYAYQAEMREAMQLYDEHLARNVTCST